jgi:hypothetical protein
MLADNYILEKDNMEDYTNKFAEKKIYEINDGNAGNYSNGTVKYQLSQLFNLNSVMNFKDGLLMIPLIINFKLTNGNVVLNAEKIKRLVSIKSGSLVNSVRIRINGKTAVSFDNNLNELMEFNFLTNCLSGNTNEWSRSMNCLLDDKYLYYNTNDPNLVQYQKFYKNVSGVSNTLETDLLIENNKLIIGKDGIYEDLNVADSLIAERQNYIKMGTAVAGNNNAELYYWVGIKLSQIHDIFDKMGISRAFVDFEVDLNLGTSKIECTTATTTKNLFDVAATQTHNYNRGTSSIYFNLDGIERSAVDAVWWKASGAATVEKLTFEASIKIDNTAGTKLHIPVYKIKPEFNELYIKDSVRTIKYNDYLYYNLNNIPSNSTTNFTISNAVSNSKYLLMIPQLTSNKLNGLNQSILSNGPIYLSNLQITKGSAVFNQPLMYSYDMFLNYIENNTNMNGGKDWVNNLFNFNNFNKLYRLYFFDLTLINNQKDVAYNLSVQFINKCKFAINVDFYVFEEKELIFNKINGVIGDVQ